MAISESLVPQFQVIHCIHSQSEPLTFFYTSFSYCHCTGKGLWANFMHYPLSQASSVTPLSSMENISSGCNIASGHNRRNIASQKSLLPVKIFCPDVIFRFFYTSSRRNLVLGDSLPWTNMD